MIGLGSYVSVHSSLSPLAACAWFHCVKVELFSGCALAYFTARSCLAASGLEKLRVREQRDKQVRADSEAQGRQLGAVQELGTKHPAACLELGTVI